MGSASVSAAFRSTPAITRYRPTSATSGGAGSEGSSESCSLGASLASPLNGLLKGLQAINSIADKTKKMNNNTVDRRVPRIELKLKLRSISIL